ncbi:MAG TPA: hypothetical protein VE177_07155, partial [Candidatus Binatus sp.]|nr:hypothetical protein [Candidatus Binatus sp.]
MSDHEILAAVREDRLIIEPAPEKINPAGVDLRADRKMLIKPGQQVLAATLEKVALSRNYLGILHLRSSFA